MAFSASASAAVIVPNVAAPVPSDRGGALFGTVRSWIIHPSYQPLSLLMTNNPEISVKMSMNAPGSLGSVGKPGFGSTTNRTAATAGRPQFDPVAVFMAVSLTPGITLVNTLG